MGHGRQEQRQQKTQAHTEGETHSSGGGEGGLGPCGPWETRTGPALDSGTHTEGDTQQWRWGGRFRALWAMGDKTRASTRLRHTQRERHTAVEVGGEVWGPVGHGRQEQAQQTSRTHTHEENLRLLRLQLVEQHAHTCARLAKPHSAHALPEQTGTTTPTDYDSRVDTDLESMGGGHHARTAETKSACAAFNAARPGH